MPLVVDLISAFQSTETWDFRFKNILKKLNNLSKLPSKQYNKDLMNAPFTKYLIAIQECGGGPTPALNKMDLELNIFCRQVLLAEDEKCIFLWFSIRKQHRRKNLNFML